MECKKKRKVHYTHENNFTIYINIKTTHTLAVNFIFIKMNAIFYLQQLTHGIQYIRNLKVAIPPFFSELPLAEIVKAILIIHAYRTSIGEGNVKHISWVQGFISCIILSSAGTCTVALLRGEPFSVIYKDEIWFIYGLIYCIMMFSNSFVFKWISFIFTNFPVLKVIFIFISGLHRGYSLVQYGVDGVTIKTENKKIIARVLCGTLTGCGGGLWNEILGLDRLQWRLTMPRLSVDVKISFWSTIVYILLTMLLTLQEDAQALGSLLFTILLIYNKVKKITHNHSNKDVSKLKKNA
ncbi:uncharacterized protein BX663DRAFT_559795 [Cokeromyces recurvatus]|uniref:uncharacterized protein n=1 Tax=Cokeromyces recurvatus TaxID=90255 RepID=UPI0022207BFF|nr:uncharacterized protein BX663DRAFT_559795 [Cokeromyces recurvatus]KAI7904839.1 hypothetical protein BX663DRAFT_559795 [Cokeromyces recurvatus]